MAYSTTTCMSCVPRHATNAVQVTNRERRLALVEDREAAVMSLLIFLVAMLSPAAAVPKMLWHHSLRVAIIECVAGDKP